MAVHSPKAGWLSVFRRGRRPFGVLAWALLLSLSDAGSGSLVAQGLQAGEKETETVRGTVVSSITKEPISRALVYSPDNRFGTMSDDSGHFAFKFPKGKNDSPDQSGSGELGFSSFGRSNFRAMSGPATLMARKPGFLQNQNGAQVYLASSTEEEVTIPLVPEALVIGRVNLGGSEGTDHLQVELFRREIQEGRENWVSAGTVQARSNGEFRFAELAAGTYKLFTHEQLDRDPLTFNPAAQVYGYPPVYYPLSHDFATASTIRVTAGATFYANLSPARREYYPVKLQVTNPPQGASMQIEVWPLGHPGPGYSLGYDTNEQSIVGMLPDGNYAVQLSAFGPTTSTGQINISVKGGGVEGAAVTLVPNSTLQVNVKTEFSSPETTSPRNSVDGEGKPVSRNGMILRSMQVILFPTDELNVVRGAGSKPPSGPNEDALLIENVQPGRYRVQVMSAPVGYIASISSGGADLLRNPLVVPYGGASSPIEITLRDDGATIEGTIENWRAETLGRKINLPGQEPASVYLVPMTGGTGPPMISWITPDGNFSLRQIPPGSYRAMAFDRRPAESEFTNEEAMKKHESKSQVLELAAGQTEQLSLQLITTGE